jgi:hypothetical protein
MNAGASATGNTEVLLELADFLREINSPLPAGEVLAQAVREWIARERHRTGPLSASAPAPASASASESGAASAGELAVPGYQWKCLFLPEGSALRMSYLGQDFFAQVQGNAVVHHGERMSPRQFTQAVAGDGRNAWRDLWLRLPGEKSWTRVMQLRRRLEQQQANRPASPLDAMRQAAACMSDTLKSALALVEHANHQALPKYDRRLALARRAQDILADACQFD